MRLLSQEQIAKFNKLYYEDSFSIRKVANRLNLDQATLRYRLKKHGILLRSREEAIKLGVVEGRYGGKDGENNPNFKHGIYNKLHNKSGIYFLYDNNELVYIGKATKSIKSRVSSHKSIGKVYNKVIAYIIESDTDIHVAELYLINLHKPKYNLGDTGEGDMSLKIDNIDSIVEETIEILL